MAGSGECRPLSKLPTLQRNALRKLFNRAEFTPEEVAALGYRRILQAEGIGAKGIATIQSWLLEYGYDLQPELPARKTAGTQGRYSQQRLETALRVLRNCGYIVQEPE
ncbi:MAG TPA: hypothetical protein VFF03_16695 [Rhodocyclaceae bacterium]|nr:hypothetical protein [Rhodocyclaceae bacterium]